MLKYINIGLTVVIIALVVFLYKIIQEPITFEKIKKHRYAKVEERLKDIRTAQLAFKSLYGSFSSDLIGLTNCVKNDSFRVIKAVGNPDDSTIVTYYDTFFVALKDSIFAPSFQIDSMKYIPFGNGELFIIDAGQITKQRTKVDVFEVNGPDSIFLRDLYSDYLKYIKVDHSISVGSMTQATITGNWE